MLDGTSQPVIEDVSVGVDTDVRNVYDCAATISLDQGIKQVTHLRDILSRLRLADEMHKGFLG